MRDDVTTTDEMSDAEEYAALDQGVLPAIAPVPVVVVQPVPTREQPSRSFVATQYAVKPGDANRVVVAKHIARTSIHLRNAGPTTLYIAQDSFVATATSGYPMPPGSSVVLDTTHDVWIFNDGVRVSDSATGITGVAGVLSTFSDGS